MQRQDELGRHDDLLPSQPLAGLHEETVRAYMGQIEAGHRPAALTVGWLEDRYVMAEWEERFVPMCILDGHHKLEAYCRTGERARIMALFRVEDSWGPPEDRRRSLREAIRQAQTTPGRLSAEFKRDAR